MTQAIPANYELASQKIRAGEWRVDADLGLVYGVKGRPFRRKNSWGYVQIKFRDPLDWHIDHAVLAHRVIWEAVHGPLSPALTINHRNGIKVDNRLLNLEVMTVGDNGRHARATGLLVPRVGVEAANARLTEDQVLVIYRRAWAGEKSHLIGQDYGVGGGIVRNIKQGWAWSHLTGHQRG
jgi:hypothetical protein